MRMMKGRNAVVCAYATMLGHGRTTKILVMKETTPLTRAARLVCPVRKPRDVMRDKTSRETETQRMPLEQRIAIPPM